MSEHTKGPVEFRGGETLAVVETPGGRESRPVAHCGGDNALANARRLSAFWNAFENVRTELVEAMIGTGAMQAASEAMSALPAAQSELAAARAQNEKLLAMVQEQDRMLGHKACATKECRELLAARALLREVLKADDDAIAELSALGLPPDGTFALTDRIRNYLDACDTLGSGNG